MNDTGPVPRLGVSVCVWRDGQTLLIRRAKAPHAGAWSPVGGMVEWGETLEQAARREVAEEAGIDIRINGLVGTRDLIFADDSGAVATHIVLVVLAADWLSGDLVAGDDADRAEWARPEDLGAVTLLPGVLPYVLASRDCRHGRLNPPAVSPTIAPTQPRT